MAKPAEVTTPEQTELLAVTRTHSGALTRYAEKENHLKSTPRAPFTPKFKAS